MQSNSQQILHFSKEQQDAYNKYIDGKNIFITGPGGTGKTALIRQIQMDAFKKCLDINVCALTGCAAVLLECKAKTVHAWSGIRKGSGSIENNVNKILKNKFAKSVWKGADILIIDEVSMMSKKLFEMLDAIGKAVRKNYKPFGGIQLIFSGDFYQLPPVGDKDEPDTMKFCFESDLWFDTFTMENHIILYQIFRQNDVIYQRILNQIREGKIRRSSNEKLLEFVGRQNDNLEIRPTKLYPTKNQVNFINETEMASILSEPIEYHLKYEYALEMTQKDKYLRQQFTQSQIEHELYYLESNLLCDKLLRIKIGAQVMCIVNLQLSNGNILCNGAQGIVIEINSDGFPIVKYYNGYIMTMHYHTWESETIPGIGVSQIPLILAWALTIHKSQGATLDIAEIDAGSGIFECGQTYVALSRVKSLNGLYLLSFDPSRIRIHKKVQEFYNTLDDYKLQQQNIIPPNIDIVEATNILSNIAIVEVEATIIQPEEIYNNFISIESIESIESINEQPPPLIINELDNN